MYVAFTITFQKIRQKFFVWQQLEHSHILPLYGTTDDFEVVPALVCPWMENGSLNAYLEKIWRKQLPPLWLCDLIWTIHDESVHSQNIIHGDLMPPNVLMDENGNALLADFGLSRLLTDHETSFFASNRPGAIRWAAPEIIIPLNAERPNEVVDPNQASDIYSFGCIMMQVLSGRPPYFDMKLEPPVIVAKSQGDPSKRPEQPAISDVYWRYIERCWSTQIETRPSVDQVLDYIKAEYDRHRLFSN
ncbi:kinase-like domain-containing protein [Suillus bovinus]|uniref:kinase-like domain-containing protein n=1 Tax=Suillus bovinus TaxID=48563 RepID=UPI001B880272|nr:kinase-like domain-containing protein [Suillus bovinus]KAG2142791.1 kinase-like domain-containing protein [Suillus bovinus]